MVFEYDPLQYNKLSIQVSDYHHSAQGNKILQFSGQCLKSRQSLKTIGYNL